MFRVKTLRRRIRISAFALALLAGSAALLVAPQNGALVISGAQARDPYSIMTDEPGDRVVHRKPRIKRPRGSSSPSPVPPYQSTVTPLGVAPQISSTPPLGQPSSPGMAVPGIGAGGGVAVTPSRPAGQSFQDRTLNCVQSGSSQGVGAGQIGAFTQSCVNQ